MALQVPEAPQRGHHALVAGNVSLGGKLVERTSQVRPDIVAKAKPIGAVRAIRSVSNLRVATMPVIASDVMAVKNVTFYPGNDELGLPTHLAIIELLRRSTGHAQVELTCGAVTLNTRTKRVAVNGNPIKLTSHEYNLLEYLMHHIGRVVSRTELVEPLRNGAIDLMIGAMREPHPPGHHGGKRPVDLGRQRQPAQGSRAQHDSDCRAVGRLDLSFGTGPAPRCGAGVVSTGALVEFGNGDQATEVLGIRIRFGE